MRTATGTAGADTLTGSNAVDVIFGEGGNDALKGNSGDDTLIGGQGNDYLNGGQGDDTLSGGQGNDLLDGKTGDDWLHGGLGNDVFRFNLGDGHDTITDFTEGEDLINFKKTGLSFADIFVSDDGTDTTVTGLGLGSVTVLGVVGLDADDFLF